jgi:hypothetical protein
MVKWSPGGGESERSISTFIRAGGARPSAVSVRVKKKESREKCQ